MAATKKQRHPSRQGAKRAKEFFFFGYLTWIYALDFTLAM